jgi:prophage antirepressor-like protein
VTETAVIKQELFMGADIRVIQTDIGPAIPAPDIARIIGCTRSNITQAVSENPHLFEGLTITEYLSSKGGKQKTVCLTRDAVIGILMRSHHKASKTEEGKEKIKKFQVWARNTLSNEMQIQTQLFKKPEAGKRWLDTASEHIQFAKIISRELGKDPEMCLAVAIRQIETDAKVDLSAYRKLIGPAQVQKTAADVQPAVKPEPEYISPSQLAGIVRMRTDEVNRYLCNKGYQIRGDDGEYYPTEKGVPFGKRFPFAADSGHNGYFVKWTREIIRESKMLENRPTRIKET